VTGAERQRIWRAKHPKASAANSRAYRERRKLALEFGLSVEQVRELILLRRADAKPELLAAVLARSPRSVAPVGRAVAAGAV
jgi:hypothetical protein